MSLRYALRYALRRILRGPFDGRGGGGDPGVDTVGTSTPRLFDLEDRQNVLDLNADGNLLFQFLTEAQTVADFNASFANIKEASAFNVEPIGVPVGARKYALLGLTESVGVQDQVDALSTFAGYGGTRQAITFQATDTTVTLPLNASVTLGATPVHIIARVLSSNATVDRVLCALMETTNADNNPRMALRVNNAGTWGGHYFNGAPASTGGSNTMTEDEWVTVICSFVVGAGGVDVTCHVIEPGAGEVFSPVVNASLIAPTGTYTRLALGGYVNLTGNTAAGAGDAVYECMVYVGALTRIQAQQFGEADCPPWDTLLPDPTGVRCWAEAVDGVIFDRTTGEVATLIADIPTAGTGSLSNITFAAYTGSPIRRHNRLLTQDASSVVKIPYSNVASGVTALPAMSSCLFRSRSGHALRYDPTDPAVAGFANLAAGVSRLYARGGAIDTNIINNSGSAGDVGTLDLVGVGYSPDLYVGHESGLSYTVTSGTIDLGGSQLGTVADDDPYNLGVTRSYAVFKPTTGSLWPCVVLSVGAGGQAGFGDYGEGEVDSEYNDVAAYLARHGYVVVVLAGADEGESSPWPTFAYTERIAEYRTMVEDELSGRIGYDAPKVVVGGHSGGTRTSLPCSGATYWFLGTPTHPGLASPDGGGEVVGCFQFSGPPITATVAAAETRSGTWTTVEVPIIMFTGTSDSAGDGADTYYDRVEGYTYVPDSVPAVKVVGNFWHHLYGGGMSVNTDAEKIRAKNQRDLSNNILLAFCDMSCDRNTAAARAFLETGPDDNQIDYTVPAGEIRYASKAIARVAPDEAFIAETAQLPLVGYLNFSPLGGVDRVFDADEQIWIGQNYYGVTSTFTDATAQRPTLAEVNGMRAIRPGFFLIDYKNSSSNPGNDLTHPPMIEADPRTLCAFYKEGAIQSTISAGATTFNVVLGGTLGLVASTAPGATTVDIDNYVVFILVENELMKLTVVGVPGGGVVSVTVTRGYAGTTPAGHPAGSAVYAPIYIGGGEPGGTQTTLRYHLQFWQPEANDLDFMAPAIAEWMNTGRNDGWWLDIFSPSPFNLVNAVGDDVTQWDFGATVPGLMTPARRRVLKEEQLGYLQTELAVLTGRTPVLAANNNRGDYESADGGAEEFCKDTAVHDPVDGLVMEGTFTSPGAAYFSDGQIADSLAMLSDGCQKDYGMWPIVKPDSGFTLLTDDADHRARDFYDYCGILMAWQTDNENARVVRMLMTDASAGPGDQVFWLPDWWRYDIGEPTQSSSGLDYSNLRSPQWDGAMNHSLRRRWTRALVVFNPTDDADSLATALPNDCFWRHPVTGVDATSVTLGANGCAVYMRYDFEVSAFGTDVSDEIGDVPTSQLTLPGAPRTYALTTPSDAFEVASDGTITLKAHVEYDPAARFILPVRITGVDGFVDTEVIIVTAP